MREGERERKEGREGRRKEREKVKGIIGTIKGSSGSSHKSRWTIKNYCHQHKSVLFNKYPLHTLPG